MYLLFAYAFEFTHFFEFISTTQLEQMARGKVTAPAKGNASAKSTAAVKGKVPTKSKAAAKDKVSKALK